MMKEIDYIYGPWFGLKLEKGTEITFAFLDEPLYAEWMKIEEICYDEVRNEIRIYIDVIPEEHHVRSFNFTTVRNFGIVTKKFFNHIGGKKACIDLVKSIFRIDNVKDTPLYIFSHRSIIFLRTYLIVSPFFLYYHQENPYIINREKYNLTIYRKDFYYGFNTEIWNQIPFYPE